MIKRTLTTLIGAAILLAVMIINNTVIFSIAATVVSLIALNEFYGAVKKKEVRPIEWLGYLSCIILLLIGFLDSRTITIVMTLMIPITMFIAFVWSIIRNAKTNIIDVATTIFGIVYVVILFSFLIYTKQMTNGAYYLWYTFGAAWVTDIFAYLIGSKFGKHKFTEISPKKSIEGCIGGIIGAVIFFIGYTYYLNMIGITSLNYVVMGILGIVASLIAQTGDLAASSIKRYCGLKDFGTIMPGHGGILDRFDSLLFVSPLIYVFFSIII